MSSAPKKEASEEQKAALAEMVAAFIQKGASVNRLTWAILGGENFISDAPVNSLEFVEAGNKGISKSSVVNLAGFMEVPLKDIANLLNISYKTLGRKKASDKMDSLASSLSIEIASTVARGLIVFEDSEKFNRWLHKKNNALQGKTPFDLLNTPTGINIVNRLLVRIEEGIYT